MTPENKRRPGVRHLILAAAILGFLSHAYYLDRLYDGICYDDAYISFRYAKNLVEGRGLVFNEGERVEGFTNLGWTMGAAAGIAAGLDPVTFSKIVGTLCAIAAMIFIFLAPRRGRRDAVFGAAWPPLALAVGASYPSAAVSGLETSAWVAAIFGALYFLARRTEEATPKFSYLVGVFLILTAIIRADGFVIAAIFLIIALRLYRLKLIEARDLARIFVPTAAIVAALIAWRFYYYHQPAPNTYYAKVDFGIFRRIYQGTTYLLRFAGVYALYFGFAIIPLRKKLSAATINIYLPLGLGYLAYLLFVGGDFPYLYRFTLPALAIFYIALAEIFSESEGQPGPRSAKYFFTVSFLMITFSGSFFFAEDLLVHRPGATLDRARITLGKWLGDNAPPDARVAVKAAGAIPYYSMLPTIDYFGLTDADVRNWPVGDGVFGHMRYSNKYLLDARPELIAGVFDKLVDEPAFVESYLPFAPQTHPDIIFWVRADYVGNIPNAIPANESAREKMRPKNLRKRLFDRPGN